MTVSIAYLGPKGTFSDFAAAAYANSIVDSADGADNESPQLQTHSTIAQAIKATEEGRADFCVVPIENSIGGGVTITLDTLWEIETLKIQQAFNLPVRHALISHAQRPNDIHSIYSHPQALTQCRDWLSTHAPQAKLIPTSSTSEPLPWVKEDAAKGAIASIWGAKSYGLPVLAHPINDFDGNSTRFWVLGQQPATHGRYTSMAFSLRNNEPGALLKPLQLFSVLNINMSRIESRPTKRSLGDYIFFIDVEASADDPAMKTALELLKMHTDTLKLFGSYELKDIEQVL